MSSNELIWAADRIGARLCRDSIWYKDRCNWISPAMEFYDNRWQVVHRSFGPDIYNGTSGIALFLAHLYKFTHESIYKDTAKAALNNARETLNLINETTKTGFYAGEVGIAYVFETCATLLNDESLQDEANILLEKITQHTPVENSIDVMMGSAGAIPALLNFKSEKKRNDLSNLAVTHGDLLLDIANRSNTHWTWDTMKVQEQKPLTGFVHGASGIAWAFLELFKSTNDIKYLEAAEKAINYEQSCFDENYQNWPDYRDQSWKDGDNKEPGYGVAWCHGAGGIGLSRLRAFEITGNNTYKKQAETAIKTTSNTLEKSNMYYGSDFSLCHGVTGNAELLLYASEVFGQQDYRNFATNQVLWGIDEYERKGDGWPCGVMGAKEVPNLFLGIAGIGYFLLRLLKTHEVKTIMMVHPYE